MMTLPSNYEWLLKEPAPRMLLEALNLYGTKEKPGTANNDMILSWADELGIKDYKADSIPWCGLFMAIVAKRAGKTVPANPLWARNWLKFGKPVTTIKLGDVLVFRRGSGGHVALYVGEDETHYHGLGGNQSDNTNIIRLNKKDLLGARSEYKIKQPSNCRKIQLAPSGIVFNGAG